MADLVEQMLKAMEIISQDAVNQNGYDRTIKALVVESYDGQSKYLCHGEDKDFFAYGESDKYKKDDEVYVNIPMNDWTQQKNIINKVLSSKELKNVTNPFEHIVNQKVIYSNKFTNNNSVIANGNSYKTGIVEPSTQTVVSAKDFYKEYQANSFYNTLGLRLKINPEGLSKYRIVKDKENGYECTYGLALVFYELGLDNKKYVKRVCEYYTDEMFGNLYGFDEGIYQEVAFDISDLNINKNLKFEVALIEKGDFSAYNPITGNVDFLDYGNGIPDGYIKLNELEIILGVDSSIYGPDTIVAKLCSEDNLFDIDRPSNRKVIKYAVFNPTKAMNQKGIKLYYRINNDAEWSDCGPHMVNENTVEIPSEALRQDRIGFAYRVRKNQEIKLEQAESDVWFESNEVACFRYRAEEYDLTNEEATAINLKYRYTHGCDPAAKPMTLDGVVEPICDEVGVKYYGLDNTLLNQIEAYSPHFINLYWNPMASILKDSKYLANATITWKIPCPIDVDDISDEERENIYAEYNEKYKDDSQLTPEEIKKKADEYIEEQIAERFFYNQKRTIFMPLRKGIEYNKNDNPIITTDSQGMTWLEFSHTFGKDFKYSDNLSKRGLNETSFASDYHYLSLRFRVKEQYLKQMTFNTIFCTIETSNHTFTSKFEVPVQTSNYVRNYNPIVVREDFEPIGVIVENNNVIPQSMKLRTIIDGYDGKEKQVLNLKLYRDYENANIEIKDETLTIKSNIPKSDNSIKSLGIYAYKNGNSIYTVKAVPTIERTSYNGTNYYQYSMINGNNKVYITYQGEVIDIAEKDSKSDSLNRPILPDFVVIPKEDTENSFWSNAHWFGRNFYEYYPGVSFDDNIKITSGFVINSYKVNEVNEIKDIKYEFPLYTCLTLKTEESDDRPVGGYINCGLPPSSELSYSIDEKDDKSRNYPYMYFSLNNLSTILVVIKYNRFADDFNAWNGKSVHIGEDVVYATAMAAGTKNRNGKFSGVILGNIGRVDQDVKNGLHGIYGYKDDEVAFSFTEDGKATIGQTGRGQIKFDGSQSIINSGSYDIDKQGISMDLSADAKFNMQQLYDTYAEGIYKKAHYFGITTSKVETEGPAAENGAVLFMGNKKRKGEPEDWFDDDGNFIPWNPDDPDQVDWENTNNFWLNWDGTMHCVKSYYDIAIGPNNDTPTTFWIDSTDFKSKGVVDDNANALLMNTKYTASGKDYTPFFLTWGGHLHANSIEATDIKICSDDTTERTVMGLVDYLKQYFVEK